MDYYLKIAQTVKNPSFFSFSPFRSKILSTHADPRDPWLSRLGRGILVAFSLNDSTERAEIDRVSTAWEKASPLFELRFHRVKRPRFNARVAADKIRAPFYACLTRARFAPLRDSNQRIRIRFLLLLSIYNISRVRFEFTRYVTRGKIFIFDPIRNDV